MFALFLVKNRYPNMKKLIALLFLLPLASCGDGSKNFTLGFSPAGLPLTLCISSTGQPSIKFSNSIKLPIGSLSLGDGTVAQNHRTYLVLNSRNDGKRYAFELTDLNEKISWETSKYTVNTVENRRFSTVVSVESEEISNLLHKKEEASSKPRFPEQPFSYFYLTKKLTGAVNWEVHGFSDLIADLLFAILWVVCLIVDLVLMVAFFILRIIWWLILLLGYLFGAT